MLHSFSALPFFSGKPNMSIARSTSTLSQYYKSVCVWEGEGGEGGVANYKNVNVQVDGKYMY